MGRPKTSARLSVLIVFFVNGAVFANWAPRIPEIQDSLSIDVATLGLALAGVGVGGLAAAPVAAVLVHRFGSGLFSRPDCCCAGRSCSPLWRCRGGRCWQLWSCSAGPTR
jgi:hypothetical protein